MPLESPTYVDDFVTTNPDGTDSKSQGDNHIRNIKSALKTTFPNASKVFRFPTTAASQTGNFSVTFPTDFNKLYPVNSAGGNIAVSLPDPTSGGTVNEDGFTVFVVKTAAANTVTITPSGVQTINGAASLVLRDAYQIVRLVWLGSVDTWIALQANSVNALDIVNGTSLTAPTIGDLLPIYDLSATANKQVSLANLLKFIVDLTDVGAAFDDALDLLAFYDASASDVKMVDLRSIVRTFSDFSENGSPGDPAADQIRMYSTASEELAWRTSAGVVALLLGVPARAFNSSAAYTEVSAVVPFDDTKPEITEGTEVVAQAITLKRATSRVRASFNVPMGQTAANFADAVASLFIAGTTEALATVYRFAQADNDAISTMLTLPGFEHAPGSVGPHTYSVRVGKSTNSGNLHINGTPSARIFGGAALVTLTLEEVFIE